MFDDQEESDRIAVKALGAMRNSGSREFIISLILLSDILINIPIRFTYFFVYFHFTAFIFPAARDLSMEETENGA
jgi:hypothetical protein